LVVCAIVGRYQTERLITTSNKEFTGIRGRSEIRRRQRFVLEHFSSQLFLGPAQLKLFGQGMPVLMYHSIGDPPAGAKDPFLFVSKTRFAEQMAMLGEQGFTSGSLDELPKQGNPGKKVVITFDDGYRNVLKNGLEVLTRHRFRAVQYIVAGLIGTRNEWDVKRGDAPEPLMDTGEIREWLAAGQEIGSHSLTHRNLALATDAEAREQIIDSKKKLEDTFGIAVRHFAYPGGGWTPVAEDVVKEAGYVTACTTRFGVNTLEISRFQLKRIFSLSESEFLGKMKHRLARKLGVR
jgi:peptidoglycan/xylan/chitin deacetylase (PgdA/CDA1 family)